MVGGACVKNNNLRELRDRIVERGVDDSSMDMYEGLYKDTEKKAERIKEANRGIDTVWLQEMFEITQEDAVEE